MFNHQRKCVFFCLCAGFIALSLGACHKENKEQQKTQTVEANAPVAEPSEAPKADAAQAPKPDAAEAPKADAAPARCEKWPDNPLFQPDREFTYQVKTDDEACCDIEGPGWECDEDGHCARNLSFDATCKVSQVTVENERCSSVISCTTTSSFKDEIESLFIAGQWGINKDGIYHIEEKFADQRNNLFNEMYFTIALAPKAKDDSSCDDNDFCHSETIENKGNEWCITTENSGGDSQTDSFCIDFKRGITSSLYQFSGGSDREITCTLK